jgi:hypothetical protein
MILKLGMSVLPMWQSPLPAIFTFAGPLVWPRFTLLEPEIRISRSVADTAER